METGEVMNSAASEDELSRKLREEVVGVFDLEKRPSFDDIKRELELLEGRLGDPEEKKLLINELSHFGPEMSPGKRFETLRNLIEMGNDEGSKLAFEAIKNLLADGGDYLENKVGFKEGIAGLLDLSMKGEWESRLLRAMNEAGLGEKGKAFLAEIVIGSDWGYQNVQEMLRKAGITFSDGETRKRIVDMFLEKFKINPEEDPGFARILDRNLTPENDGLGQEAA